MKRSKNVARLLAISDPHCGHRYGLTPRSWWNMCEDEKDDIFPRKTYPMFEQMLEQNGPFDGVVCGGDAIDGRGEKSGGSELITTNRLKQVEIFGDVCKTIEKHLNPGAKWAGAIGTAYHTGSCEDWESIFSKLKGAPDIKIGSHEWLEYRGYVIDLKHHVGRSALPHGVYTPIARDLMWNWLWNALCEGQPRADAIVRGHTHYLAYCGNAFGWAMTLPCLTWGSKHGVRRCSEMIHWGISYCDIDQEGRGTWGWDVRYADCMKPKIYKMG